MSTKTYAAGLLAVLCIVPLASVFGGEWPQFLGVNRNGTSAETGLVETFPEDGAEVVWKQPLGVGMSGIAISDGLAFTLYQDDTSQYLTALDAGSGEQKWKT